MNWEECRCGQLTDDNMRIQVWWDMTLCCKAQYVMNNFYRDVVPCYNSLNMNLASLEIDPWPLFGMQMSLWTTLASGADAEAWNIFPLMY